VKLAALPRRRLVWLCAVALLGTLGVALVGRFRPRDDRPTPEESPAVAVEWSFEQTERGAIISTPTLADDSVYVTAIRDSALAPSGVVYCLDRRRGSVRWQFDDGGSMQHTISSPCLADGRLYLGEGMHGNDVCKLYCLEAASGRKLWQFVTGGHIESSPCVADGAVFFGSGDDGLYGLDAVSGGKRWHFQGRRHIDSSPAVAGRRLYAGSGVSLLYPTTEVFCLDAAGGALLWRTPTDLPVWGSPLVRDEQVFFGLGNGRLTQSAQAPEKPAGALLCADASTGRTCWIYRLDDAVFGRPAADEEHVYFGARDGRCYCLDRRDGRRRWAVELGSPIVANPALLDGRLYVVASGGRVSYLDAASGRVRWTFDVARHTQTRPHLLSSPVVRAEEDAAGSHHRLYFGAELRNPIKSTAVLYCLRDGGGPRRRGP
jgi:outer membrane protein assembly factor BamB